jgi:hypothetical protein
VWFVIFWIEGIGAKAARKLLVKLTTSLLSRNSKSNLIQLYLTHLILKIQFTEQFKIKTTPI